MTGQSASAGGHDPVVVSDDCGMTTDVHLEQVREQLVAIVRDRVPITEIGSVIGPALAEVADVLERQHVAPTGPPFARYGMSAEQFDIATGFPTSAVVAPSGRVTSATLPAGTVATAMHVGPYDQVAAVYDAILAWVSERGLVQDGDAWESYLDGPDVARPRTIVSVPVRPQSA